MLDRKILLVLVVIIGFSLDFGGPAVAQNIAEVKE